MAVAYKILRIGGLNVLSVQANGDLPHYLLMTFTFIAKSFTSHTEDCDTMLSREVKPVKPIKKLG